MKDFLFEYYIADPETGEDGEIRAGWLQAESYDQALALIKAQPLFYMKVDLYEANMNKGDKYAPYIIPLDFIRKVVVRFMDDFQDLSTIGLITVDPLNLVYTFKDLDINETYVVTETDLRRAFSQMYVATHWPEHLPKPPVSMSPGEWDSFWSQADAECSEAFTKIAIFQEA